MECTDADTLARLARELDAETDLTRVLQRVVDVALTEITGAEHAGVTLLEQRGVSTPAYTDELVVQVDRVQYSTGEGPCLQAALDGAEFIRVDDLRAESRWPRFRPHAVGLGVLAVLSFQLYARRDTIGALNLYAAKPQPFTDESVHMGQLLAAHAAVGLAATRKELNLQVALQSRDVIGQAKGILMERFKVTSQEAFNILVAASQHRHRKLREIAEELVSTGQLRDLD